MATQSEERRVTIADSTIEYQVVQSTEATEPRIDVGIHGITVVIPEQMDIDPTELVVENSQWILEKKRTYDRYRADAPERRFEPGEEFPFLGTPHTVTVESILEHNVSDGTLRLAKTAVEHSSIRAELEALYKQEAKQHITERVDHYAERMELAYERIEFRKQRTRWGSCSVRGTLSFNWRLMMTPPDVIDYVIVHELAHLEERTHTQRFWRLVSEYVPEYEDAVDWLDRNSSKLIFDRTDL
jgi:predicted metal-dependent hydrolase